MAAGFYGMRMPILSPALPPVFRFDVCVPLQAAPCRDLNFGRETSPA
jgi:hypothetical protein